MDVLEHWSDRPSKNRFLGLAIAGVVLTVLGAGGVAYAANNQTPSPSSPTPSAAPTVPNREPGHGPGRLRFGFGFGGALHGEFTVPKQGGGYQTVAIQNGTVQKVSDDSITVKSEDGFTKTYKVTSTTWVDATRDGIGSVKTGNTVSVQATVSGSTSTAVRIFDISLAKQIRAPWAPFGHRMRPGQGNGAPNGGSGNGSGTPSPGATPS